MYKSKLCGKSAKTSSVNMFLRLLLCFLIVCIAISTAQWGMGYPGMGMGGMGGYGMRGYGGYGGYGRGMGMGRRWGGGGYPMMGWGR
ncbi:hypothetical protein L596_021712 [Steinernema carpocapsae]|uniref:Uncharacterized protein n=1 Tax=Steinernema carpocapsae TaxID=34508 RepID=A0A4U5MJX6_STECR|nr:hypothetical protein L596_021712 [Steinernema carpocapsae]